MKVEDLIRIADEAYPDGKVQEAFEAECGSLDELMVGDTLAVFIARELKETFDEEASATDQLECALQSIETATKEINAVRAALEQAWLDLPDAAPEEACPVRRKKS
ncbi:MAG: hypothetical protein ABSH28_05130 [Acidobacteriota bacterium]|jgi:hypothetical protein